MINYLYCVVYVLIYECLNSHNTELLKCKFVHSENDLIIANKLVDVPMISANKPKTPIIVFFTIIHILAAPVFPFKNTSVSIRAGNASPSVDRQKAPNKLINRSSFGMATAKRTREKEE